jgi:hypothetical protein
MPLVIIGGWGVGLDVAWPTEKGLETAAIGFPS